MPIKRQTQRDKLKPNNQPYWEELGRGVWLGYRKTESGRDSWNVRKRIAGEYKFSRIGGPDMEWEDAKAVAEEWAGHVEITGSATSPTVEAVCKDYVERLV